MEVPDLVLANFLPEISATIVEMEVGTMPQKVEGVTKER